jgi:glycosyltransferase involved in cell wall biosynthesis
MAKHGRAGILIPNGVTLPAIPTTSGALEPYGLHPGRYVLLVSRLVPEKRHLDLIEAFRRARMDGWKLVIVGAADHADTYSARVAEAAALDPVVVMTGFQSGLALREFYAHAGVFVLPSSHEGLPIALLEALSFGLRTLASAIPANLEVGLPDDCYFPLGDTARLASLLQQLSAASPIADDERERRREWVAGKFSWERSASATLGVYEQVAGQGI